MDLAGQGNRSFRATDGYAMAALLVGLSVMSVLMSMAFPVWSHMVKREKEEELIWRGQQYARAVGLFQRKYANAFPPTLDVLVEQKFLRKKYKDPITNDDFQLIPATGGSPVPGMGGGPGARAPGMMGTPSGGFGGRGREPTGPVAQPQGRGGTVTPAVAGAGNINLGISGVVSKSKANSIKIYNGRQKHNEWAFVYMQTAQAIGAPGAAGSPFPGMPGQPMPGRGNTPLSPGQPGMPGGRGSTFTPFGPGTPGMPGGRGMPPLPPGRGFQMPSPPGGRGQPMQPFGAPRQPGQMQPFGVPPKPPGN
jgi:type II secretory pathway pseudopilin PulG